MKIRQLITVVIALTAITSVGSAFADRPSDEPVGMSSKTQAESALMNSGGRVYIYEWARPEWIRQNMEGAQGVAGSRYSGRTREEVKAETMEDLKNHKPGSGELYMYGR